MHNGQEQHTQEFITPLIFTSYIWLQMIFIRFAGENLWTQHRNLILGHNDQQQHTGTQPTTPPGYIYKRKPGKTDQSLEFLYFYILSSSWASRPWSTIIMKSGSGATNTWYMSFFIYIQWLREFASYFRKFHSYLREFISYLRKLTSYLRDFTLRKVSSLVGSRSLTIDLHKTEWGNTTDPLKECFRI